MAGRRLWGDCGSLPGLAAVLLVMVVASIGFSSALNIPDPLANLTHTTSLLSTIESHKIIGGIQNLDGSITPITVNNDPDFVASMAAFKLAVPTTTVKFAVVYSVPNPAGNAFVTTALGAHDTSVPDVPTTTYYNPRCIAAAQAYNFSGPFSSNKILVCVVVTRPTDNHQYVIVVPAALKYGG